MNIAILGSSKITFEIIKSIYALREISNFKLVLILGDSSIMSQSQILYPNTQFVVSTNRSEKIILERIRKLKVNLIVSVKHKFIFSKEFLDIVKQPVYNIHNAKLPDYKGHNTISFDILNNEKYHFTTLHIIDEKIEAGFVILEKSVNINNDDTALSLFEKTVILCKA